MVANEQNGAAGTEPATAPPTVVLKRGAVDETAAGTLTEAAPSSKHAKKADADTQPVRAVLNPELMSEASRARLKAAYRAAEPYLHCVMEVSSSGIAPRVGSSSSSSVRSSC